MGHHVRGLSRGAGGPIPIIHLCFRLPHGYYIGSDSHYSRRKQAESPPRKWQGDRSQHGEYVVIPSTLVLCPAVQSCCAAVELHAMTVQDHDIKALEECTSGTQSQALPTTVQSSRTTQSGSQSEKQIGLATRHRRPG